MKAMSTRNDEPQRASRPFDRNRDGFIMGEGAGILVLESLEHARARGARIYCELAGYAATCDAYHITQPDPDGKGLSMAMRRALASAGVAPARRGLHQRPRDLDPVQRQVRDARDQAGVRRARAHGAHQLDQVDDRATCSGPRAASSRSSA